MSTMITFEGILRQRQSDLASVPGLARPIRRQSPAAASAKADTTERWGLLIWQYTAKYLLFRAEHYDSVTL